MQRVPIDNIYYLLCYAWNRLAERDLVNVRITDCNHVLDLFARVLSFGTAHLLRRGPDRGYVGFSDELRTLRGRIDLPVTVKRLLQLSGRAQCHYDEISHNILHNRILKTTIARLIRHSELGKENRDKLALLARQLRQVDEIELCPSLFSRVQLNRNNAFYGFLLSVCRLIYINVLAREGQGDYSFQDFVRDPGQMGLLFQDFVHNFLKLELEPRVPGCRVVGAEIIHWDVVADEATKAILPEMKTDISIMWPDRYLVIDTKFYSQTMQVHFGAETVHSANLFQLCTYLQQIDTKGPEYERCEGMLLYPTVTKELDYEFDTHGHRVMVKTLDLTQPWLQIHQRILGIVEPSLAVCNTGVLGSGLAFCYS